MIWLQLHVENDDDDEGQRRDKCSVTGILRLVRLWKNKENVWFHYKKRKWRYRESICDTLVKKYTFTHKVCIHWSVKQPLWWSSQLKCDILSRLTRRFCSCALCSRRSCQGYTLLSKKNTRTEETDNIKLKRKKRKCEAGGEVESLSLNIFRCSSEERGSTQRQSDEAAEGPSIFSQQCHRTDRELRKTVRLLQFKQD